MSVGTWFVCWLICSSFGTYVLCGIRHYMYNGQEYKSKIKIVDLLVGSVLGLVPGLNILAAAFFIIASIVIMIGEVYSFHSEFFDKELFPKKKSDKTKDDY